MVTTAGPLRIPKYECGPRTQRDPSPICTQAGPLMHYRRAKSQSTGTVPSRDDGQTPNHYGPVRAAPEKGVQHPTVVPVD